MALAVAFVSPADARRPMREAGSEVVTTMARALRESADAARAGDAEAAYEALELARSTESSLASWRTTVQAAEEVRLLSPLRRSAAREARANRRAIGPVDRAVRNLRVALRRMVVVVEQGAVTGADTDLAEALDQMAGALFTVPGALRDPEGEGGRRLRAALDAVAARLDPATLTGGDLSSTVVVAQLRSAVVDLYEIAGVDAEQAKAQLV